MTTNTLSPEFSNFATPLLDISFVAIDWQAPWLCHLSQLDYLSHIVEALSNQTSHLGIINVDYQGIDSQSTTIIADVLNTAMQQQSHDLKSNDLKKSLPQTKPTNGSQAHHLKFVSQDALPEGEGYEHFIATTGNIPTRNNLHDLFNGSIWLTFPKTKALLNYHHMREIAQKINKQDSSASRGRVRDTITVFDENGAILVTSKPSIGEALIDFNWQASLVTPRNEWGNPRAPHADAKAAVYIFGHALLEQLLQPRKTLCSHSVVINVESTFFTLTNAEKMIYLDNRLAEYLHQLLSQNNVTPRQLSPLPILGVPHFWPDNVHSKFYDDTQVFRNGRRRQVP